MKLYGIRYAKGFRYGTMETIFRTQKGNRELIADFSFFYYLAETEGGHFLIDTGFRDRLMAAEMGVSLLSTDEEIRRVFGSFPEIDAIFLTHSHWDHINNIDLYPNARLIMSKLTYESAVSEGTAEVKDRLLETNALISLVEERECFYDRFHFEVIGGHTPDSSVLYLVLVYKCGQEKLNNLYYQVKEQRRCSTWRRTKNLTLRNLNSRSWICIMPEEPRIQNWNVNMA